MNINDKKKKTIIFLNGDAFIILFTKFFNIFLFKNPNVNVLRKYFFIFFQFRAVDIKLTSQVFPLF